MVEKQTPIEENGCENKPQHWTGHAPGEQRFTRNQMALCRLYLLCQSKFRKRKLSKPRQIGQWRIVSSGPLSFPSATNRREQRAAGLHHVSESTANPAGEAGGSFQRGVSIAAPLRWSITGWGTETYQSGAEASTQVTPDKKLEEVSLVMNHPAETLSLQ